MHICTCMGSECSCKVAIGTKNTLKWQTCTNCHTVAAAYTAYTAYKHMRIFARP